MAAAEEAGRDPRALRRETRVDTDAGESGAETVEQGARPSAAAPTASTSISPMSPGSAGEPLERAEELVAVLRA